MATYYYLDEISMESGKKWIGGIRLYYYQDTYENITYLYAKAYDKKTDDRPSSPLNGKPFEGSLNIGTLSEPIKYAQAEKDETQRAELYATVVHDEKGKASVNVSCTITAPTDKNFSLSGIDLYGSKTVTLPQIDRNPPKISCTISDTSFDGESGEFTFSASVDCKVSSWYYKIDGSKWFSLDTGSTTAEKTLYVDEAGKHELYIRAYKNSNGIRADSDKIEIDLTQPNITISSSNITANGFTVSAVSDVTSKTWMYSLDDGDTWSIFSTAEGTIASFTFSGLSANTVYKVKIAAIRVSNNSKGFSNTSEVKTLGGTVLHSVNNIIADASSARITLKLTVYDSAFYYKVVIKNDVTEMLSVKGKKFSSAGTGWFNITLTASERTSLLSKMPTIKSFSGTLYLSTYTDPDCTKQVGGTVSGSCNVVTSEANSHPTFSSVTYRDTLPGVVAITKDDQILVQNCSFVEVTCSDYSALNGATITSFSASIADASVTSASDVLSIGTINASGNVTLTVKVIDSRGYAATKSIVLNIIPYSPPTISNLTLRRRNEIEDIIELRFNGQISEICINGGANQNELQLIGYSYRQSDQPTFGAFHNLSVTMYGNSFSFETNELMHLDTERSFYFHFRVQDLFGTDSSYDVDILLLKGTPLISIRKRTREHDFPRVGINTSDPKAPLDVMGNIHMNGHNVLGFVKELDGTEYLSGIEEPGIYIQKTAINARPSMGYPLAYAGILEVSGNPSIAIVQKYQPLNMTCVCIRTGIWQSSYLSWTDWYKIATQRI